MKALLLVVGAGAALLLIGAVVWVYVVQNVETPAYLTVAADGPFEVRDYPAMTVAEVERQGGRKPALGQGFQALAGYIFARDREGPRIAMTAPVIQQPGAPGQWQVAFVMPRGAAPEDLPTPANADVKLSNRPAARLAAIRFSGHPTDKDLAVREAELRAWLSARDLHPVGAAIHAYYNDPFTPGFLRRNEVMLALPAE